MLRKGFYKHRTIKIVSTLSSRKDKILAKKQPHFHLQTGQPRQREAMVYA